MRTCANDGPHRTDIGGDHGAVRQPADPHGHVDVIVKQVQVPVRQQEPNIDLRMGGEEFDDDRQNVQPAEEYRSCQGQFAARRVKLA